MSKHTPNSANSGTEQNRAKYRGAKATLRRLRYELWKSKARIPMVWFQHRNFRPTDVFFGSYPRSGSTWSRFVLYEILTGQESSFEAVNATFCGMAGYQSAPPVLPGNGRFIQTHELYRKEYKRAVYLVRDGRDVLLSEYAFVTALGRFHGTLEEFTVAFLKGKVNGYGAWHNHARSWLHSPIAGSSDLLVVRFEDLRSNPEQWFKHMAEFLGFDAQIGVIRQAIANNSLDKMRAKEMRSPQKASVNGRFVRNGAVQGWRNRLMTAQLVMIDEKAADVLIRLKYPVCAQVSQDGPVLSTLHSQANAS